MRLTMIRRLVGPAVALTLGIGIVSGLQPESNAQHGGTVAPADMIEQPMTKRVIGGQYTAMVPIQFVLQGLCVRCLFGIAASQEIDYVAAVGCAVICSAAF